VVLQVLYFTMAFITFFYFQHFLSPKGFGFSRGASRFRSPKYQKQVIMHGNPRNQEPFVVKRAILFTARAAGPAAAQGGPIISCRPTAGCPLGNEVAICF
jgi:hypothetical protein